MPDPSSPTLSTADARALRRDLLSVSQRSATEPAWLAWFERVGPLDRAWAAGNPKALPLAHRVLADGRQALGWEVRRQAKVWQGLARAGVDLNATMPDARGDRPLHAAARASEAVVVKALLLAGADPNALNTGGEAPLSVVPYTSWTRGSCDTRVALLRRAAPEGLLGATGSVLFDWVLASSSARASDVLREAGRPSLIPAWHHRPDPAHATPYEALLDAVATAQRLRPLQPHPLASWSVEWVARMDQHALEQTPRAAGGRRGPIARL